MTPRRLTTLLPIVLLCAASVWAQDGPRTALVIGNAAYEHLGALRNPANDARDMASALATLGFAVTTLIDASWAQMDEAVYEFGQALAVRGGAGLFYYAGHGVEAGGVNYLVPVEQRIRSERELPGKAISVDRVLAEMEYARNGTNIIILDACRDNPLPPDARSSGSGRGLSVVQAPSGSLVVYATSPGNVAQDGRGRNGVFTGALLQEIRTPGINVMDMLVNVRREVMRLTGNAQTPWENSSLTGPFFFGGGAGAGDAAGSGVGAGTSAQTVATHPETPSVVRDGQTAPLYVDTDPPAAVVFINGVEIGRAPQFVEEIPVGIDTAVEAREGTLSAREVVRPLRSDVIELRLTLTQEVGSIAVLTSRRGFEIRIDGVVVGVLDSGVVRDVPVGDRIFELIGDGEYYRGSLAIPANAFAQVTPEFVEVGTITHALPAGASVALTGPDGSTRTLQGSGTVVYAPAGAYRGTITGLASADETVSFTLSRGATQEVSPTKGDLRITSTPAGATVYVDGTRRGVTPLTVSDLVAGSVSYRLSADGHEDAEGTRTVTAGRTTSVTETLVELPGSLRITSTPAGAEVYIDGTRRGVTPLTVGDLAAGSVNYRLSKEDHASAEGTWTVAAGRTTGVSETLVEFGSLRITSTPSGAEVYIDGTRRGVTPLTVSDLAAGSVAYRLSKDGHVSAEGAWTVAAGRTTSVSETLVEGYGIGDRGPAGGIVFYDKGECSDGWRYLEAWTTDEAGTYRWKTSRTTTGGTSTSIGSGYANTYTAMDGSAHPAAEVCRNATHGGYTDWFLPSKDELNQLYSQRSAVGGFASSSYWGSSEDDSDDAWSQYFDGGYQDAGYKNSFRRVRAVRGF